MATYSFWSLVSDYSIEIPIIQRDYAQGRDSASEIRREFLNNIYKHLQQSKRLDLDFVYGSLNNQIFIPLDGQQRLTTLFLLHWFLLSKEDALDEPAKTCLSKFSYETRTSSRDFCAALVNKGITHTEILEVIASGEPEALSQKIADAEWFFRSWRKDPTIQSMLVMLDAICEKFKDEKGIVSRLVDNANPIIAFQFIELRDFGLTDNLYIKMNARGKSLTDFEIFKAKFEQFLEGKENDTRNFKKEFSDNIDGKWADFFWKHKQHNLIDKPFMRFFNFITEMLYYYDFEAKTESNYYPKVTFELIEHVYDLDNLDFLFDALNKLCEIGDINGFWNQIFSTTNHIAGKVCLFDANVDLFDYCLKNDTWDIRERILLFSVIQFCINKDTSTATEDLKDLVRVVRNLLLRVRQPDYLGYKSNLRIYNLGDQVAAIGQHLVLPAGNVYQVLANITVDIKGFTKESVGFEKEKAEIICTNSALKPHIFQFEDHYLIKGSLHNFDIKKTPSKIPAIKDAFEQIWATKNDSLITRAILTIGDYSISMGNSKLGGKWFFGNGGYWHTILTNYDRKVKDILPKFIDSYISLDELSAKLKLNKMITEWLAKNTGRSWQYYFIKYSEITNSNNNLYAWGDEFEVRRLSGISLKSSHINPFVKSVVALINDDKIANYEDCIGNDANATPLWLRNGARMSCFDTGWLLRLPDNYTIKDNLIIKYQLTKTEHGTYWLKDDTSNDRIEVAVNFSKEITLVKRVSANPTV